MSKEQINSSALITEELAGQRLDQAVSKLMPEHSRARIQSWIKQGEITLNGEVCKQKDIVKTGDEILFCIKLQTLAEIEPEDIPLTIIHQDKSLVVINKPAGLVVHPGAGNPNQTLQNALLHFDINLRLIPRAGIIHRLDKDTTGLMLIARTPTAHTFLVEQLQLRNIKREYLALVCGKITAGGTIDTHFGRHPTRRTQMAVTRNGKRAITHYRVHTRYKHYTLLNVMLDTGRTHQIRVHMAYLKYPIVGDKEYGKHQSIEKGIDENLKQTISAFSRQALHAHQLTLPHPDTKEIMTVQANTPDDMQTMITQLDTYDAK
ncbi:MAG: 23S rRNA pseudouridine(1911/1915/1917) synthase RluD [Pseudomonadota bacterium]